MKPCLFPSLVVSFEGDEGHIPMRQVSYPPGGEGLYQGRGQGAQVLPYPEDEGAGLFSP